MNIAICKCGKSKYTYDFITSECCDRYYFKYFCGGMGYLAYSVTIKNKANNIYYNISNIRLPQNTFKVHAYNNHSFDKCYLTINVEDKNLKLYYLENILDKYILNSIFE